jgi:hypothetical protein
MRSDITLLCNNKIAEIQISSKKEYNNTIIHERVEFLLYDNEIIGFRINNLRDGEEETVIDYIERKISGKSP